MSGRHWLKIDNDGVGRDEYINLSLINVVSFAPDSPAYAARLGFYGADGQLITEELVGESAKAAYASFKLWLAENKTEIL